MEKHGNLDRLILKVRSRDIDRFKSFYEVAKKNGRKMDGHNA